VPPGYAATALQSTTQSALQNGFMWLMNRLIAQPEERGAWSALYAIVEDLPGDSFIGPDGPGEIRGHPTQAKRTDAAKDDATARELWRLSEELTGVRFTFADVGN
jgi:hypothetical protein